MAGWFGSLLHRVRLEFHHSVLNRWGTRPPPGGEHVPAFDRRLPTGIAGYGPSREFRTKRRQRPPTDGGSAR